MTEFVTVEFDTRDFEKSLKALGEKVARKVVKRALLKGAEVLADSQRDFAPVRTDGVPGGNALAPGALRDDIQIELKMSGIKERASVDVGPGEATSYVGRFIEDGHDIVTHGKKRKRRIVGHVDAKPWMGPAFDAAAQAALDKISEVIAEGIDENLESGSADAGVAEVA